MTDLTELMGRLNLTTVQMSHLLSAAQPSVHRWRHQQALPTGLSKLFLQLISDLLEGRTDEEAALLGGQLADLLRLRGCPAALRLILNLSLEEGDDY